MAKLDAIMFEDGNLHDFSLQFRPKEDRSSYIDKDGKTVVMNDETFWLQVQDFDPDTNEIKRVGCFVSPEDALQLIAWLQKKLEIG